MSLAIKLWASSLASHTCTPEILLNKKYIRLEQGLPKYGNYSVCPEPMMIEKLKMKITTK